ncbi:hypothetical protein PINS_up003017 [Pythium insidiosum]|nr:hypothetical protein PINS_up003017 [Pythium insidiosum]
MIPAAARSASLHAQIQRDMRDVQRYLEARLPAHESISLGVNTAHVSEYVDEIQQYVAQKRKMRRAQQQPPPHHRRRLHCLACIRSSHGGMRIRCNSQPPFHRHRLRLLDRRSRRRRHLHRWQRLRALVWRGSHRQSQ